MVEPKVLDDFGPRHWAGFDYKDPGTLTSIIFQATIVEISNRNLDPRDDYVKVCMFGPEYQGKTLCGRVIPEPFKLQREYISRIWHVEEARH
ncbi:MAG: hypothetical protein WC979_05945 [Candidatus Pacearchaeota archaeon]|jgi:hypothetical protein